MNTKLQFNKHYRKENIIRKGYKKEIIVRKVN